MGFTEAFKLAISSLWVNKLRSILTILGVVIGVAAVIMVMTLVSGANQFVAKKIYGLGADVFAVAKEPAVILSDAEYMKYQKRKDLRLEDYEAVAERCGDCTDTGAEGTTPGKVAYRNHSSENTEIRGWTMDMPSITSTGVVIGRGFVKAEEERRAHVAIIGYDIVDQQMGREDPIGKEIRIDGQHYTVIGVGERKGQTLGQSQDNWAAIPLSTFLAVYGSDRSLSIFARARGAGPPLELASGEVRSILRVRRHDAPGAEDSFSLVANQTVMGLWKSFSSSFAAVLISLAAISLVVGGIVIMNIMLVSVTERTREIGVRKALGARARDVMLQFLIESAALSMTGGVVGVAGGIAVAKMVTLIAGFPSDIRLLPVLLGLFTAGAVGIFFGVYPARKAARLDPILALRREI